MPRLKQESPKQESQAAMSSGFQAQVFLFWERARRFVLLGVEGNSPFVCCPTQRPHGSRPRHSGNTQGPAGVLWDGLGNRVFQGTNLRRGSEGQTPTMGSNPSSDRQFRVGMDPILRSICDPASCASQNIAIGASSGHRWREPWWGIEWRKPRRRRRGATRTSCWGSAGQLFFVDHRVFAPSAASRGSRTDVGTSTFGRPLICPLGPDFAVPRS